LGIDCSAISPDADVNKALAGLSQALADQVPGAQAKILNQVQILYDSLDLEIDQASAAVSTQKAKSQNCLKNLTMTATMPPSR
jgi:hypothetical protein